MTTHPADTLLVDVWILRARARGLKTQRLETKVVRVVRSRVQWGWGCGRVRRLPSWWKVHPRGRGTRSRLGESQRSNGCRRAALFCALLLFPDDTVAYKGGHRGSRVTFSRFRLPYI